MLNGHQILRTVVVAGCIAIASLSFAGQKSAHAKITAAQAQKTALAKYPGKVLGKVELENEDGSWQYAVMIRSGKKLREVMVDAKTGKIANVEETTDEKEAKEKAAEAKGKAKGKKKGGG